MIINDSHIEPQMTFRKLVFLNMQQLTNFPYIEKDFDALTDYQLLCKVVEYLNMVIKNSNDQNDSITNLYNAFISLQDYVNTNFDDLETAFNNLETYVNNYFDSQDWQQMVNNKLDDMLESGVLEQIIEQFIQSTAIWCFDTIADMLQATNLINGSFARTLGYYSVNDNGGAIYKITDTASLTDYQEELASGLYATLINEKYVTPEMYGAYGDGVHDDSTAIQTAINSNKVIELSPKTYICFSLLSENPLVIHGNNATLKRPNLSIEPYNYTETQMRSVNTIRIYNDVKLDNINFDNNCFTMWSLEDGYAQGLSASLLLTNSDTKFNAYIDNCTFKNSAGDGILISNNVIAFITNCESTETFRGGLTIAGTSEVNVDGWISNSITLPDGFDVEMGTGAVAGNFILNMNNIIMDYDLDLDIPANGKCNITNLIMRPFDQDNTNGFIFTGHGTLNITNSLLRAGINSNYSIYLTNNANINLDNCEIIGSNTGTLFDTLIQSGSSNFKFNVNNCNIICYDLLHMSIANGYISFKNCNIECSNSFLLARGSTAPQPKFLLVDNCRIKNGGTDFMYISKTSYASFEEGVNLYLNNLNLEGTGKMHFGGSPKIHYNNLKMEALYDNTFNSGSNPTFIGKDRFIVVAEASELTFRGWKQNNDIALALDDGNYYKYTTGTTWTVI